MPLLTHSEVSRSAPSSFRFSVILRLTFGASLRLFFRRHAMTLAMLVSDPLHSLNASPLQTDCSAADGANPADAALGDTSSAKPIAGIMKFRIDMSH